MRPPRFALPLLLLLAGLAGGYLLGGGLATPPPAEEPSREIRSPAQPGGLIRPLLECEVGPSGKARRELLVFHDHLESFVASLEADPRLTRVAFYFRDLDNGPWMGVREDLRFAPGSVLKVPLIMACYRQAERNPAFLDREVAFLAPESPWSYVFPPAERLEPGRRYTVRELMRRTAEFSDNDAAELLAGALEPEVFSAVLADLGIATDDLTRPTTTSTAEELGRFFRLLYNASYLGRESSEEALRFFTRARFDQGLVAGVPPGTVVAHKFGERARQGEFQLHDCGIVYHPRRPYLLCVMTEGSDPEVQSAAIAALSTLVYREVSLQMGE